jgi:hypothetical protein
MNVQAQIDQYISEQPQPKAEELQDLHRIVLRISPNCKLWFLDGRDRENRVVSNPNIGYGSKTMKYANGETREFYQVGLSANTTGISLYVMGIEDRKHLSNTYGGRLGKASITGYCIRFKSTKDIEIPVFEEIVANYLAGEPARGL